MHDYWVEFSKVAVAHLLAVASPGPDFAIVLKQSLAHGRRPAIWTSIGVGSAILMHASYSLLGLGLLISSSQVWFNTLKYAGAAYIAWLGVQALRSKPRKMEGELRAPAQERHGPDVSDSAAVPSERSAFATGFFTNALNPKATLFIISLFALVVSPRTPKLIQAGYAVWLSLATIAWFCLVAMIFTQAEVRRSFLRHGHWIDRVLGLVFLALAASLLLAKRT
jgi:RhtB (resistance to homoserine/threonine) family protein